MTVRVSLPTLLATLLVGTGCTGVPTGSPGATVVVMYDNQFSGSVARVPVGATVTWINLGGSVHAVLSADGSWRTPDAAPRSGDGGKGPSHRFDQAGVYRYYCNYHGTKDGQGMSGVVVVGEVDYSPSARGKIEPVSVPSGRTRAVPTAYPTIQAAVDAASPGDLIMVDKGVYREEVTVTTPSLVIRGVDRNQVIIDGEFVRGNGISVLADAVAIENLTARNAVLNGFFWTGVTGFRASYLTAYNNGDYGIYAFGSQDGLFEDSYASGSPDSGFYIGQCYPCRTVLRRLTAENNALGYSGTNAGGELYLVSSVWRNNGAGIVPSSLDIELNPPQRDAVFAANLVVDNDNPGAPAGSLTALALGNGILLAGGVGDVVERNLVLGHRGHGILVTPIQDQHFYPSVNNVVRNNQVFGSGRADLANSGPGASGNCFAGNRFGSAAPFGLAWMQACRGFRLPRWSDFVPYLTVLYRGVIAPRKDFADWKTQPPPPPQPTMPDPLTAPVRIAMKVFDSLHFDVNAAPLPAEADSLLALYTAGPREAGVGPLGRLFANGSFLIVPVMLGWWLLAALRRKSGKPRPRWRWLRRLVTVVGLYLLVTAASAAYFGRW